MIDETHLRRFETAVSWDAVAMVRLGPGRHRMVRVGKSAKPTEGGNCVMPVHIPTDEWLYNDKCRW